MATNDINYMNTINLKLNGIAKGLGVEFKGETNRQSQGFREQMKQKQRERRNKVNG